VGHCYLEKYAYLCIIPLLKSFDEPFTAVNALLKVIQDKGEELKSLK
jgi:hypothetical protein